MLSKLFKKKENNHLNERTVEEFMMLIRVYYQGVMAMNLGITNMNMLPDLALFKRMLKIPTQNNKLGLGEKSKAKKILISDYNLQEDFFKEIESSIKKNCKTQIQIQPYFFKFQGLCTDLFNLLDKVMSFKYRLSMLVKSMLRKQTKKLVNEIFTKSEWKDVNDQKAAWSVKKAAESLDYSQQWISELVYGTILLARNNVRKKNKKE